MKTYGKTTPKPTCRLWVILLLIQAAIFLLPTLAAADISSLWIQQAYLIDPESEGPPRLADVRIEEGRIVEIREAQPNRPHKALDLPAVDAGGRFLVPGFIDTHAHVALGPVTLEIGEGTPQMKVIQDSEVVRRSLLALLAHGITTVRDPGGPAQTLVHLRDQLEHHQRIGPRLRVAGEVIDRQPFLGLTTAVDSPEEVRAEVRRQAKVGVDWIKLYTQLSPEELKAGIAEAHAQGLPAVAHLQRISWTDAAKWGLDALVHVVPGSEQLLPEETHKAYLPDFAGTRCLYSWFEHVDLNAPKIQDMLTTLQTQGTTLDLTLVAFEGMVHGDDPSRTRNSPELSLAAPSLVANWRRLFTFNIGWEAADFTRARQAWPTALALAQRLHEAGVHLTIGTDANNPWTVPGPSFHRELELLAEAGIPNRDLLLMATRNGAEALKLDDRIGRLQIGYEADLVLLERNPLIDISATREIVWVMRSGKRFVPEDLLKRLLEGSSAGKP